MVASGSAPSQRPLEPGTAPRLIVPSGQRGAGGARRPGPPPRPCALAVAVHNIVSAQTRKRLTFIVVLLLGTLVQQPAPKASAPPSHAATTYSAVGISGCEPPQTISTCSERSPVSGDLFTFMTAPSIAARSPSAR